jgi:uncharacterized membrane protein (GlpM family)
VTQILVRFLLGGAVVTAFSLLADVLRPKGFAGLFGAAPSVALATLMLASFGQGAGIAALEARSMIVGEIAFVVYALACVYFFAVRLRTTTTIAFSLLGLWAVVAAVLYIVALR